MNAAFQLVRQRPVTFLAGFALAAVLVVSATVGFGPFGSTRGEVERDPVVVVPPPAVPLDERVAVAEELNQRRNPFVRIAGGQFLMGTLPNVGEPREQPRHSVTV
ncbi:MAG: hypothetical protein OSB03_17095, partial [Vicinamibacterales bacterium]|nr:hypothetical protein [Vicinamibacterales bacterium]